MTFNYRFASEDPAPLLLRLKVEVNTREHFSARGLRRVPFAVDFRWFTGRCDINTYDLDELLGTKLRALYQRRKGRDLFDTATALAREDVDPMRVVSAVGRYMEEAGHRVTRAEFERNLLAKIEDRRFVMDLPPLLASGQDWDVAEAATLLLEKVGPQLP